MNRTSIRLAGLLALGLAGASAHVNAQNLILKSNSGAVLTQYPLQSSNGCVVVSGGDIEVRPQAAGGTSNDGWCPAGSSGPTLVTFPAGLAVTPTTIFAGSSVSATWTSANANTCTGNVTRNGTGTTVTGWSGTRALSQGAPGLSFNIPTEGNYVFSISCQNTSTGAPVVVSTALTVTVQLGGGGDECPSGVNPSFGLTRQTSFVNTVHLQGNGGFPNGALNVTSYDAFFGTWPARTQNRTIAIYPNKYVALQLDTGVVTAAVYGGTTANPNRFGNHETFVPAANSGQVLKSFGLCQGQFETNLAMPDNTNGTNYCRLQTGQAQWPYVVGISAPFACVMQPETTYYLNASYTSFITGSSSCVSPEGSGGSNPGSCHWFSQPR